MLVISSSKTPPSFDKCVNSYLFKISAGLFVGDVTYRVLEYLKEEVPRNIGKGHAYLLWKNSNNPRGFDLFEYTGDGVSQGSEIDGLFFPHL